MPQPLRSTSDTRVPRNSAGSTNGCLGGGSTFQITAPTSKGVLYYRSHRRSGAYPPLLADNALGDCILEGCLRDETVGPSMAVLIDNLVGGEISLTEVGFWCIAELMNKRYKRNPNINNPPHIQPHIRRWLYLSGNNWESSIVILRRFFYRSFTLRFTGIPLPSRANLSCRRGCSKVRATKKINITI